MSVSTSTNSATLPLAVIESLTVRFGVDAPPAVSDVSLQVHPGECVALVGESGSGKTLTAKSLLGLLPRAAIVTGSVTITGSAATLEGDTTWQAIRGRTVALIPQDALGSLDPLRRIEHEVGDSLRVHGLAHGGERKRRIVDSLRDAGMPAPETQMRKRSDQLSGGLKQRALVASALVTEPSLIVADEPTTALDAGHRSRVLEELRRRVDLGSGVLLISHDLEIVRQIADRVLVMRAGEVIEQGDIESVLARPRHPFTRSLIDASPVGQVRSSSHQPESVAVPRLEFRGVSAGYRSGAPSVLRDTSFSVYPGETVGLVGESGSGKTTLLRVALGLHRASHGQVLIDGEDLSRTSVASRREMRQRVGFVPQDPLDTFRRASTAQSILVDALRAARVPRAKRAGEAAALAAEVHLAPTLLGRDVFTLSGGQRQRLAIARALAKKPDLVLLDEPVSALDLTVQARVLDLLCEVQARRGTAFLFVSHDLDVVRYMSDRVLQLKVGKVSQE